MAHISSPTLMCLLLNYYNKVNKISFAYNFEYLLIYIDLVFLLKVSPLKCRMLEIIGPEILPKCFRWLV